MRASAAVAYLHPAMERANLTVMPYMQVHRVLFEGTRAVGVQASQLGQAAGAAGRARGDPVRRRLQLAAAADALGDRPGRAPDDARNRGAARPAGGRREPLRPRGHAARVDDARAAEPAARARAGGAGGVRSDADRAVRLQPRRGRRLRARRRRTRRRPTSSFTSRRCRSSTRACAIPRRHGVWVSPCLLTPAAAGARCAWPRTTRRPSRSSTTSSTPRATTCSG